MATFVVDIDETICHYPDERVYEQAQPYTHRIEHFNKLLEEGHDVIYWTARGSTTGIDYTKLTHSQLEAWGAKYTRLMMGKPHYDYFICDKAINVDEYFS
jgi:hypothetical protein